MNQRELEVKRINASNESLFRALKTYDTKVFGSHLKTWAYSEYKYYKSISDFEKKKLMCKTIVKLSEQLNDQQLVKKAKKWLDTHKLEKK